MMNSATLKTMREACGLSVSDLAGLIPSPKAPGETVKERTVQYWEKGRNNIPEDVAETIRNIDAAININVNFYMDSLPKGASSTTLYRFKDVENFWRLYPKMAPLPVTCHAAMLNRIRLRLDSAQIEWYEK